MRMLGIIQCRSASTRLPGKAHLPLRGRTVLEWVMARALRCAALDRVVVATTDRPEDDAVAARAESAGLEVFRGDSGDVLSRYVGVLERFPAEGVVRITADNPLTDPATVDGVVRIFREGGHDFAYAARVPYGCGADAFRADLLRAAARESKDPRHQEHINTWFLDNHLRCRIGFLEPGPGRERPDVRVTLDTPEDLRVLCALFDVLDDPESCGLDEIIAAYESLRA